VKSNGVKKAAGEESLGRASAENLKLQLILISRKAEEKKTG